MKPVSYSNIVLLKLARRIELGQITFEKATKYMSESDKTKLKDFCKGYEALGQSFKLNAFAADIDASLIKFIKWQEDDYDKSVQMYITDYLDKDEKVIFQEVVADLYKDEDKLVATYAWNRSLVPYVTNAAEAMEEADSFHEYEEMLITKEDKQKAIDDINKNIAVAKSTHLTTAYYEWGLSLIYDLIGGQF